MTKLRRKARLVSVCACDVGQTSASFTRRGEKKHLKAKEKALHSSVFNYNLFNHETTNAKLYTDERKMFEFLWHDIRTCSVAMGEGKKREHRARLTSSHTTASTEGEKEL
jgi:hypothetical protein